MSFQRTQSLLFTLVTIAGLLLSANSWAWVEKHITSHEARVVLGRNGNAHVEQVLQFKVRGGPLRTLDIEIADKKLTSLGEVSMFKKLGKMQAMQPVPSTISQRPDGSLRVEINDREGVRTGAYELRFAYDTDLLAEEKITRDGAMLSVTWVGPKLGVGVDNDKCVFAIPSSPSTPVAGKGPSDTLGSDSEQGIDMPPPYLATLVRMPEVDEMTLIRPHVSKDEQVQWTVRVDPSALNDVHDPGLTTPAAIAQQVPRIPPSQRMLYLSVGAALAFLISLLLTWKHHEVARAAKQTGGAVRPLIPVGIAVRVAFAGPILAVSIAAQLLLETPHAGTLGVLIATALLAYRTPAQKRTPRGPGKWLAISSKDVLDAARLAPSGWLDISTRGGKIVFSLTLIAYGAGVAWIAQRFPYYAYLMAADSVVLFALFATGRWNEQPGNRLGRAAPWLNKLLANLRKMDEFSDARLSIVARFPKGSKAADELRVRVMPKASVRGLKSIEIGLGWAHGQGGTLAVPEVLLRVLEGSACHRTITSAVGSPRWLRGRDTHERVLTFEPVLPTVEFTARKVVEAVKLTRAGANDSVRKRPAKVPSRRPNIVRPRMRVTAR